MGANIREPSRVGERGPASHLAARQRARFLESGHASAVEQPALCAAFRVFEFHPVSEGGCLYLRAKRLQASAKCLPWGFEAQSKQAAAHDRS
jgi:hypothetical protein